MAVAAQRGAAGQVAGLTSPLRTAMRPRSFLLMKVKTMGKMTWPTIHGGLKRQMRATRTGMPGNTLPMMNLIAAGSKFFSFSPFRSLMMTMCQSEKLVDMCRRQLAST